MSNIVDKIDAEVAKLEASIPDAIRNKSYSEVGYIVCRLDELGDLRDLAAAGHV